jgi:hypothetical protein
VLLVRPRNPIKVGLGMGDVPIVVNAVAMFGRKVCKVEKRNIANKGTAFSLLIVMVMGISPKAQRMKMCRIKRIKLSNFK